MGGDEPASQDGSPRRAAAVASASPGWPRFAWHWGSTEMERASAFGCDAALPGPDAVCYRAVSVRAAPAIVFRWLCQLRAAPYSYDWIDNGGRRSPQTLTPGLDALAEGQPLMRIFDLVSFERDRQITCRLRRPGVFPPMAISYRVDATSESASRLVVKLAMRSRGGWRDRLAIALLPPLDWVMMRRQLLELKRLAERTPEVAGGGSFP